MTFEFAVHPTFNFLASFAEKFNIPVFKNSLKIPAALGQGFIKQIELEKGIKFVFHHYTLKQDFHLRRLAPEEKNDLISIVFNSHEIPTTISDERQTAIQFLEIKPLPFKLTPAV